MLGNGEIIEVLIFIIEDVVVQRCLKWYLGIGDCSERRYGEEFIFFEFYVSGDDQFLFFGVPKSINAVSDVAEKIALDRTIIEFSSFGDDFRGNAVESDTAELAKMIETGFLPEPCFVGGFAVREGFCG